MRSKKLKELVGSTYSSSSPSAPVKAIKKKLLSLLRADTSPEVKTPPSKAPALSLKDIFSLSRTRGQPPRSGSPDSSTQESGTTMLQKVSFDVLSKIKNGVCKNGEGDKKTMRSMSKERTLIRLCDESASDIAQDVSSILGGNNETDGVSSPQECNDGNAVENILSVSWFSKASLTLSKRRKVVRKERKAKWVIKNTQNNRFDRLMRICAQKLGTESAFEILRKLGRETGTNECNSLIKLYISEARKIDNEEDSSVQVEKVLMLFKFMSEQGFQIEEATYRPVFLYLIDMKMIQEFQLFSEIVRKENCKSHPRLGYYDMLLWINVGDEAKIQELCNCIVNRDGEDDYNLAESYILALCDRDRKEEILQFLDGLDITRISSLVYVASIFKSLGRLSLENYAENFILSLQTAETKEENISSIICDYVVCMPNLAVEEVVSKFRFLHEKLDVTPCTAAYRKLITFFCVASEVCAAIDAIDQMCQSGLVPSDEHFHPLFCAIDRTGEFDLVHPVYAMMRKHKLSPKDDIIESLINSFTRMRDFAAAHSLLSDLDELNKTPTTSMYNALMAGYFRENDTHGALMVLKQMEEFAVERDAETFSYLITNCKCEEDIVKVEIIRSPLSRYTETLKSALVDLSARSFLILLSARETSLLYHDEMKQSGVQVTKQVIMAFINAFATCGNFERAKEIVQDQEVPPKHLNEIKSVLISALATNGKVTDALEVYDEIKQAGCTPQPKAAFNLIEYLCSEGELDRLLQLLGELTDSRFWFGASGRVFLYCVHYNLLNDAAELLKHMKEKDEMCANTFLDQAFSELWERDPPILETGLELLRIVKEELHIHPSRTSLDFLLSACVKARDPISAKLIGEEYDRCGLPFNALTYLRMYQALFAAGELKAAKDLRERIPKYDPHVRLVMRACTTVSSVPQSKDGREK